MMKFPRVFPLLALIVGVVLPALPAEGQTEINGGTATGIERPGKTGVTILGRSTPGTGAPNALFSPCRPSVTVFDVIRDAVGSDVEPANIGNMVLTLDFEDLDTCIYVDDDTSRTTPNVDLRLDARNDGKINFRLEYREGSYLDTGGNPTTPMGCPPGPVTLLTNFVLAADIGLGRQAIPVMDTAVWRCFGPRARPSDFLRTP